MAFAGNKFSMRTCTTMSYGWEIKLIKQNLINHANMKFGNGNDQENKTSHQQIEEFKPSENKSAFLDLDLLEEFQSIKIN